MILSELAGYFASLLMGVILGLTGAGGSILTMPILIYLFGIPAFNATAYSLGIVGLVASWGAFKAFKTNELQFRTGISFGVPGVLGVLISRKILLPQLPESRDSIILISFSILMIAASVSMIANINPSSKSTKNKESPKIYFLILTGLIIGVLAGFVGAGGGFLIVPAMIHFAKLDMKLAIGTSLFIISMQSILGLSADFHALSQLNFTLFFYIAILALVGMTFGTKMRNKISSKKLKFGFGIFVLIMGAFILAEQLLFRGI